MLLSDVVDLPAILEKSPPKGGEDIFLAFALDSSVPLLTAGPNAELYRCCVPPFMFAGAETSRGRGSRTRLSDTGPSPSPLNPDVLPPPSTAAVIACLSSARRRLDCDEAALTLDKDEFDGKGGKGGSGISLGGGIGGGGDVNLALPEAEADAMEAVVAEDFRGVITWFEPSPFDNALFMPI